MKDAVVTSIVILAVLVIASYIFRFIPMRPESDQSSWIVHRLNDRGDIVESFFCNEKPIFFPEYIVIYPIGSNEVRISSCVPILFRPNSKSEDARLNAIERAGAKAARNKESSTLNPYREYTEEWGVWQKGWHTENNKGLEDNLYGPS